MTTMAVDGNGVSMPIVALGTAAVVAFTGTSAQSDVLVSNIYRFLATEPCFLVFGTNPTATTAGHYLAGGIPEYFKVPVGGKVAVIQAASGGNLYLSQCL
jgi:hypothetical protein